MLAAGSPTVAPVTDCGAFAILASISSGEYLYGSLVL